MAKPDKEAYPFKFAGLNWTFITKMHKDNNNKLTLSFYLKLLNDSEINNMVDKSNQKSNTQVVSEDYNEKSKLDSRIMTVYYQFNRNGSDVSEHNLIKCFHKNKNQPMLLWKFEHIELESLALYDHTFSVKMSLDIVYSGILTHISKNTDIYYKNKTINILVLSDIFALLENIPKTSNAQDAAFGLLCRWIY